MFRRTQRLTAAFSLAAFVTISIPGPEAQIANRLPVKPAPPEPDLRKRLLPLENRAVLQPSQPIGPNGFLAWRGCESYDPATNRLEMTGGQGFIGTNANAVSVTWRSSKAVTHYLVEIFVFIKTPTTGPASKYRTLVPNTTQVLEETFPVGSRHIRFVRETRGFEGLQHLEFGSRSPSARWTLKSIVVSRHRPVASADRLPE